MFIAPVPETGDQPNMVRAFSHRPAVMEAWQQLNGSIKAESDLRRYELATIAAARRLRSSYCMLAHGTVLIERFMEPDALRAIVTDHRSAGLDEADVAIMDLAEKVADDATSVTQADIVACGASGCPRPRCSTSSSPPRRAASSARCSTPSALSRTASTRSSSRTCATRWWSAARSAGDDLGRQRDLALDRVGHRRA